MIFINTLLIKSNTTRKELRNFLNIPISCFNSKFYFKQDYTINELEKIKEFFIKKGVITENFDIGELLVEV